MRSFIVCALVCLMGCGAAPDTTEGRVTGTSSPVTGGGTGSDDQGNQPDDCAVGYRWVMVWENGVATPQLQPVICNQGPDFNTGDPGPDRGDPNPWEANVNLDKISNTIKANSPTKM